MQVKLPGNMQTKKSGTRWHHNAKASHRFSQLDMEDLYVYDTRDYAPEHTLLGMEKVATLKEIYNTLSIEVIQDVLSATKYEMDAAASMLSEMVLEKTQVDSAPTAPVIDVSTEVEHEEEEFSDFEDEEDWTVAVAPTTQNRSESQQWVMIQDEWEVLDDAGEKVRSFAEVLKSTRKDVVVCPSLPALSVPQPLVPLVSDSNQVKKVNEDEFGSVIQENEYTTRALGVRKRKALRMRRR